MVICRGRLIEHGDMDEVVLQPSHPYSQLLIESVPNHNPHHRWQQSRNEIAVDSSEYAFSSGACVPKARCPQAIHVCQPQRPLCLIANTKASQQRTGFWYHDEFRPDNVDTETQ